MMRGGNRLIGHLSMLLGGMLGASTLAFAAAGTTTTLVESLSPSVTFSRASPPLETYVGYKVTVANDVGNTINNIFFEATTNIASFSSAEGASCEPINGTATIRCPIGQLTAGARLSFTLLFVSPFETSNYTTFTISGRTIYGEGLDPRDEKFEPWDSVVVALVDESKTEVETIIPKSGGDFSTHGDQFITKLSVPPSSIVTIAKIKEEAAGGNCNSFVTCYTSNISIVDSDDNLAIFSPYLTIVLQMDAANIKKGTKIESVSIQYVDEYNASHDVGPCASPTTPNFNGIPCIAKRTHYKNKQVKGWTPDLNGDFLWELINTSNGLFSLF